MAETAPVAQFQQKSLPLYQLRVKGMIISTRVYDKTHYTLMRLPAADEWSHPATVEVGSKHKLGNRDEIWEGVCVVGGMPNDFDTKDKQTGEMTTVYTARNFLNVVE